MLEQIQIQIHKVIADMQNTLKKYCKLLYMPVIKLSKVSSVWLYGSCSCFSFIRGDVMLLNYVNNIITVFLILSAANGYIIVLM